VHIICNVVSATDLSSFPRQYATALLTPRIPHRDQIYCTRKQSSLKDPKDYSKCNQNFPVVNEAKALHIRVSNELMQYRSIARGDYHHHNTPEERDARKECSRTKCANHDSAGKLEQHVGSEKDQEDDRLWSSDISSALLVIFSRECHYLRNEFPWRGLSPSPSCRRH
jgi:hypothetical protein